MYAIAFDLNMENLRIFYPNNSIGNAYNDIKTILLKYGFERQQGSVYFGDNKVNAVTCFNAVSDLTESYDWFATSVRDIRMLRIEDDNDLIPVIDRTLKLKNKTN